ncbi:hypothetical protein QMK19_38615 [Streptomyces sp. H10-C2]|uniref:hypothetical protein n=1 Tax=unclassified Streptomyces TaxID=2593676 RepID=UPI0024BA28CC|nr:MULTISPECIES: hypothetical protein [unclassified Streptomyces]MDJ0346822.1 hypothetical protein [Streptomyces sp. PH10-H1]MDJ0375353.1 hypothetical protein [Streptomyces sp. H10-C2]
MTLQTGVEIYQFVRDRLEEQRDEQHPDGHQVYADARRKAKQLSQTHANAVAAEDTGAAQRTLVGLYAMADDWKHHPDNPPATAAPPAG